MEKTWQKGTVIRIEDETATTKRFYLQVEGVERFDFKPGQFVTLDLPIHEAKNKRLRSYSIASWPDGGNVFELVIVYMEGGSGTEFLFNETAIGTTLDFRGPLGHFVLPEKIEKDLYFICTGTGIAPFRSMVHHILKNNIPHRKLYLVFGCRTFGDTLYGAELRELQEEVPDFFYIPTYSRETSTDHLVRTGYVHEVYEELVRIGTGENDGQLPPAGFYLCGWKNMISEARQRIAALGYGKSDIHLEIYG